MKTRRGGGRAALALGRAHVLVLEGEERLGGDRLLADRGARLHTRSSNHRAVDLDPALYGGFDQADAVQLEDELERLTKQRDELARRQS